MTGGGWGQQQQQQQIQRPKIPVRAITIMIHFVYYLFCIHTSFYHYESMLERMFTDVFVKPIAGLEHFEYACAYYNTEEMCKLPFFEFYDGQYVGINPNIERAYFEEYMSNRDNEYKYFYSYPKITRFRYYPPRLCTPSDSSIIINL